MIRLEHTYFTPLHILIYFAHVEATVPSNIYLLIALWKNARVTAEAIYHTTTLLIPVPHTYIIPLKTQQKFLAGFSIESLVKLHKIARGKHERRIAG